jgi:hypothetical protein
VDVVARALRLEPGLPAQKGHAVIQIWQPPPIEIFRTPTFGVLTFNGVVPFRVPTPDSRVQLSLTLLWSQPEAVGGAVPFDMTLGGTASWALWLVAREFDVGGAGAAIPTTNLVGTKAAPLALPSDVNIDGYSDDFSGGQDEIYGELTIGFPNLSPANGLRCALQARYEPGPCAICDAEWLEIIRSCTPQLLGPPVVGATNT